MAKRTIRRNPVARKNTSSAGNAHAHLTETNLDEFALAGRNNSHACEQCRIKLELIAALYADIEAGLPQTHHERMQKLAENLGYEENLLLKPFDTKIKLRSIGSGRALFLLGEQVINESAMQQFTLAIFAIPSRRLIARVAKQRHASQYSIHILSEEADLAEYIIVGIPGVIRTTVAPTNNQGVAILSSVVPVDWSASDLILILPNQIFDLKEGLSPENTVGDGMQVLATHGQEVTLSVSPHITHVMAVMENRNPVVREVTTGQATFTREEALTMRQLRTFSEKRQEHKPA